MWAPEAARCPLISLDASFVPDVRLGFCLSREVAVSTGGWAECSFHGEALAMHPVASPLLASRV
jgi:hypothetical protein